QEVWDYLDVLSNHEAFTNHMFKDYEFSGPASGVGARLSAVNNAPMAQDVTEIEVLEVEPPHRSVEQGVGAKGKRRTQGTYTLDELPDGGTRISFQLEFLEMPANERIVGPFIRAGMKRANGKAMRRLRRQLLQRVGAGG